MACVIHGWLQSSLNMAACRLKLPPSEGFNRQYLQPQIRVLDGLSGKTSWQHTWAAKMPTKTQPGGEIKTISFIKYSRTKNHRVRTPKSIKGQILFQPTCVKLGICTKLVFIYTISSAHPTASISQNQFHWILPNPISVLSKYLQFLDPICIFKYYEIFLQLE